ncbi:MAG: HlyD family efflux transporter periplasmic adaptor subunit [Nostocaceae cyanobacterium]|nr:HlyD family efflux transporter periplasmic adaptor subunit [Nostocaceae cyanobacterium]
MTTQFVTAPGEELQPQPLAAPQQKLEPPYQKPPKGKFTLPLLVLTGLVAMAAIATPIWYYLSGPQTTGLQLSGRIEGYETDLGAKIPGRVNFVAVREGDRVTQGELIVRLDDAELQAKLAGAKARVVSSQQTVEQASLSISVIETQIKEAKLNLQQAKGDTQGKISQAQSGVAAAQAQLSEAQAQLQSAIANAKLAKTIRNRNAFLYRQGAYNRQQLDEAQTALDTSEAVVKARQASVNAAIKQVNVAKGVLVQAETTSLNPDIRITKIEVLQQQLNLAKSQLAAAQAGVENAKANEQQILAQLDDLQVKSPINGVVTSRSVEPGAVVGSGRILLTIIDPNSVYMRGYIPEGEIGKVKVGNPVKVWLDSFPNQPLNAHVSAVDTQASFTPENIYFKQDRVKQVFGVKISIDKPRGLAKPGMPADAEIDVNK